MLHIKPTDDRVLIKPHEAINMSKGGIAIPETATERPRKGTVVAVGPGKLLEDVNASRHGIMLYEKGDVVVYGRYAGEELEHNGEEFVIMRQGDVISQLVED